MIAAVLVAVVAAYVAWSFFDLHVLRWERRHGLDWVTRTPVQESRDMIH